MIMLAVLLMPFAMSGARAAISTSTVVEGHCGNAGPAPAHHATTADCALTCAAIATPTAHLIDPATNVPASPAWPSDTVYREVVPSLATPPPKHA